MDVSYLCCSGDGYFSGCMVNKSVSGRVITDDWKREVTIPHKPSRIVSLTYGTDEILLGLVDVKRVAALSKYAGDPGISFVTMKQKEMVGRTVDNNGEIIMSLHPELVIASNSIPPDLLHTLSASGVPVYIAQTPTDWDGMEKRIRGISRAVDEEEKGNQMIQEMRDKRKALEEKLSVITPGRERTALGLTFRGILGKKGTLFCEILRMARVNDGAARYDIHSIPKGSSTFTSVEVIPEINPDVLLLPVWDSKKKRNPSEFVNEIMTNPAFQQVTAVREKKLVLFPERYKFVMSQHITDAMEASAKAVYPELFDDTDILTLKED